MATDNKEYQLLMLIATPKLGDRAAEMFLKSALPVQYKLAAEGTASSEIMDTLGLGSTDKCIIVSTVPRSFGSAMLGKLHSELRLDAVNSGIAFTIPLTGVSNLLLKIMNKTEEDTDSLINGKDYSIMSDKSYVLISAIVNRGFSGEVMTAARAAGAGGGTVLHSRSIADEGVKTFWGMSVQEERDIVLILAAKDDKIAIMSAIGQSCGMNSEAKGVVLSLPIDSVMGI